MSFGLWASPLGRYAANRGAPSSFGVPVFGILAGMVMLDETATFWQWIGGALVNAYIKAMLRQIDRPVAKVHLDFHILIK